MTKTVTSNQKRKGLIAKMNSEFSLAVRIATKRVFGPQCPLCPLRWGSAILGHPIEQCFHFFSRAHKRTLWEPLNAIGSCAGCNLLYEHDAAFAARVRDWHRSMFGRKVWENLEAAWHTISKHSLEELEDVRSGISPENVAFAWREAMKSAKNDAAEDDS